MTREEIVAVMEYENPDALLADGFEEAFVGVSRRCGQPSLVTYSYRLGVECLINREGMTYEEAVEWMEFNAVFAWVGPHTPVWLMEPETS
jgi:hypothetical protein